MPIYEYKCSGCDEQIEVLQKMSDDPLVECPSCEGGKLTKKVSAAAFRLKGGGWYETDFKSGNKKNLAGGGDSSGDTKDGADGAKKDSATKASDSAPKSDSASSKSSGSSTTSSSSAKDG
ncbi:MAG: zinc ribbon domain-containing protein [Pseudomonadota bacterium]